MHQQILFVHGGGDTWYQTDTALVNSLSKHLGDQYNIHYPLIMPDKDKPDFGWLQQIDEQFKKVVDHVIIVAHSFGASMILKYLSEYNIAKKINVIFLLATPFWEGSKEWEKPFVLLPDFASKLPLNTPIYFYQSKDDAEIPFSNVEKYQHMTKGATFRALKTGGHQLDNDLSVVAMDIKGLKKSTAQTG